MTDTKTKSGFGFQAEKINSSDFQLSPRRSQYYNIQSLIAENSYTVQPDLLAALEKIDLVYRSLCSILFNFVPQSGHPGGSISSGRMVAQLIYQNMDYDFTRPDAREADIICYAAGHKAMGLYAMWALRNECVRLSRPDLLPSEKFQLRLEDLLGFRRNPITNTPLFLKHGAKPLDGHPTPQTPFVHLATGASGVGVTTAMGLAFGALDSFRENAPKIHMIEGEGGMTPGRVQEAMAAAASAQLKNIVLHVDWNQSSIDSDAVCREGKDAGDYVQWTPMDLAWVNDWNVIEVSDGFDFKQIAAAQMIAKTAISNDQPTAIIYRTQKGWRYGIEGAPSHGAGHAFCSEGFSQSLTEFEGTFNVQFPTFEGEKTPAHMEKVFYQYLELIRETLKNEKQTTDMLASEINQSKIRLEESHRKFHVQAPTISRLYDDPALSPQNVPEELSLTPGTSVTLRGVLGDTFGFLNRKSRGALMGSSADLFGSTSVSNLAKHFPKGYYNSVTNPDARLIRIGGICEDAMGGFMAGLSTFGNHIGIGSSYGAFIAALQHVTARLHAIGQEARKKGFGDKFNPFVIICGHTGPRTGEDGPTHADPQPLQLLQENFPRGTMITLTPWDTQEIWPLVIAALKSRPAIIAPFVTRPSETVIDREKLGFSPASAAAKGVYALRRADQQKSRYHGTLVLQGNAVGHAFAAEVLPELDKQGLNLNIFYIASLELFDLLPAEEKEAIFPQTLAAEAMGITEFTLPTMYRWITSSQGRKRTLHAFSNDSFNGSGQAEVVLKEAGLDAEGQRAAIIDYAEYIENR